MISVNEQIIYWGKLLGYNIIDVVEFVEYIKENYVKNKKEVVLENVELMEYKIDIDLLDWEKVCDKDCDYEKLADDCYLNVFRLEHESLELKRLNLIE